MISASYHHLESDSRACKPAAASLQAPVRRGVEKSVQFAARTDGEVRGQGQGTSNIELKRQTHSHSKSVAKAKPSCCVVDQENCKCWGDVCSKAPRAKVLTMGLWSPVPPDSHMSVFKSRLQQCHSHGKYVYRLGLLVTFSFVYVSSYEPDCKIEGGK